MTTVAAKGLADIEGIDALLSDYAARLPQLYDLTLNDSFSAASRSKETQNQLRAKFHCSALRPSQIAEKTVRDLPGFKALDAKAAEMDVAVTVAVCHFKPGPDADGLYKVKNPEALVIVRAEPDDPYTDSVITLYEDAFRIPVLKTLALTGKPPEPDKPVVMPVLKLKI